MRRFSAVAQKIIQVYQKSYKPASNSLSQNEYSLETATPTQTTNEMSIRADHAFTDKNHLSGSFIYHRTPRLLANYAAASAPGTTDGGPLSDSRTQLVTGHSYRVSDSYAIRPNLLNVASLTYNRYWNGNVQLDSGDWPSTLGFGQTGWHNFPAITFGASRNGVAESNIGNSWTNHYIGQTYIFNDAISWVFGRHTIKVGGEFWRQPISSTSGTDIASL